MIDACSSPGGSPGPSPGTRGDIAVWIDATGVGRLLAASATSDIADAHVVLCARAAQQPIVTSDPDDLQALDPVAQLVPI